MFALVVQLLGAGVRLSGAAGVDVLVRQADGGHSAHASLMHVPDRRPAVNDATLADARLGNLAALPSTAGLVDDLSHHGHHANPVCEGVCAQGAIVRAWRVVAPALVSESPPVWQAPIYHDPTLLPLRRPPRA
ncbi:MAG: hypothetical protein R3E87_18805 [Burkholderiaceae bacterium]